MIVVLATLTVIATCCNAWYLSNFTKLCFYVEQKFSETRWRWNAYHSAVKSHLWGKLCLSCYNIPVAKKLPCIFSSYPIPPQAHTIIFAQSEFGRKKVDGLMLFIWNCHQIAGHLIDSLHQSHCHSNLLVCQGSKTVVSLQFEFTPLPMKNKTKAVNNRLFILVYVECSMYCIYINTQKYKVNKNKTKKIHIVFNLSKNPLSPIGNTK